MSIVIPSHVIESVRKGDKKEFGKLIESCSHYVYSIALKFLGDQDDARDAAQESFIKLWENIHTYKSGFKFSTWLYKIVANTCMDKLRRQNRLNQIFERTGTPEQQEMTGARLDSIDFEGKQFVEFIRLIAGRLVGKQHAVFVLHDLEELNQDEISDILGMSKGRIKSNLYYARKTIRQILIASDKKKMKPNHEL